MIKTKINDKWFSGEMIKHHIVQVVVVIRKSTTLKQVYAETDENVSTVDIDRC